MMDYLPPDCPPHDTIIYLTLDDSIEKIKSGVSVRCYHGIRRAGIHTIAELMECDREKLTQIRNFGKASVDEIIKFLNSLKSGRGSFRVVSSYEVQKFETENNDKASVTFYDESGVVRDDIPLENLNLSGRSYNRLKKSGYHLASQLIGLTESRLFAIKDLGLTSVNEIMSAIKSLHFSETEMKSPTIKENVSCKTFVSEISKAFQNIHGGMLYVELSPIFLKAEEIGENVSNRELFKNDYLRNAVKDEIFLFLSGMNFGAYLDDVFELFPENTVEMDVIAEIVDEMKSEGKIADSKFGNRIECKRISVFEHIQSVLKDKENKYYEILLKRLQKLTLEEISVQYNITREGIRQIVVKVLRHLRKTATFAEDKYIDLFQKYGFLQEDFSVAFGEDESVYNYLRLVCEKSGTKPLEEFIEDESLPEELKNYAKIALAARTDVQYVTVGGERLCKNRQDIADYVVRKYFQDEGSFDAFLGYYAMTLVGLGLADDAKLKMNDDRTYETFFFDSDKVLWKLGRRFRFYDIESRDFTEFLRELALEQYNDVEYSSLKFFRDNPELMRRHDIRDEYELHNLLKKLYRKLGNDSINFNRMPMMEFGKADREAQVPLNLRAEQVSFEFPEIAEQIN